MSIQRALRSVILQFIKNPRARNPAPRTGHYVAPDTAGENFLDRARSADRVAGNLRSPARTALSAIAITDRPKDDGLRKD